LVRLLWWENTGRLPGDDIDFHDVLGGYAVEFCASHASDEGRLLQAGIAVNDAAANVKAGGSCRNGSASPLFDGVADYLVANPPEVVVKDSGDVIIPSRCFVVGERDGRAGKRMSAGGERLGVVRLPLSFYVKGEHRLPSLASRLWIEVIARVSMRHAGAAVLLRVSSAEVMSWVYTSDARVARRKLVAAALGELSSFVFDGTASPLVSVVDADAVMRGDDVLFRVEIPRGWHVGPMYSRDALRCYAKTSALLWRGYVGLVARMWHPGSTVIPVGRRRWAASEHAWRYGRRWFVDGGRVAGVAAADDLLAVFYPGTTAVGVARRQLVTRSHRAAMKLISDGHFQLLGGRVLPPKEAESQ